MATDTLRNARVALEDGLITAADFEAVKVAFLKAQQYKAGLDAGFITPTDYAEVKARFLDDVAALSVSGSHSAAGGGPAPSGRSTGEAPTGAANPGTLVVASALREPHPPPACSAACCRSRNNFLYNALARSALEYERLVCPQRTAPATADPRPRRGDPPAMGTRPRRRRPQPWRPTARRRCPPTSRGWAARCGRTKAPRCVLCRRPCVLCRGNFSLPYHQRAGRIAT